ncbi:pentatricopeptide repeat-containing protein At2g22410, mitochondrial-like [Aristolochia californica]|uniref:pentatricopeptide repeat-containing protein At2g22410, mitochondrial-like n=1 Tax=Aristolochia californica TaxID=171875 RepID=UPI0035D72785
MSYLYFRPKAAPRTKWLEELQNKVISILDSCPTIKEVNQIHALMIRTGLIEDAFVVGRIIAFFTVPSIYFRMDYARRIFYQIHQPNVFLWNSMIRGYTQSQAPEDALSIFKEMLLRGFSADNYTYPVLIKACFQLRSIETGRILHGQISKCCFNSNMIVMSGLVNLYASCGKIELAREVFDEMPERDVVSWTTMIFGYVQFACYREAFHLFDQMKMEAVEPNKVTLLSLLSACAQLQDLEKGRWFHSYIVENKMDSDLPVCNALVNMYARCGSLSSAIEIFKKTPAKNTISWNALISGLCKSGLAEEALELFWQMEHSGVEPSEITVVSALSACAQVGDLLQGRLLHNYITEHKIKFDIFARNALMNMYMKCGDPGEALTIFHQTPDRDVFSWTALITGYVQGNQFKEALALFQEMHLSRIKPNEITLVSLLSACSQMGALDQGISIHAYIEENNVKQDLCLENALVDMYAKCGCIERALLVFDNMLVKDTFSWNAVIGGLALNGTGGMAIDLFTQMERLGSIKPDHVTLTAVLCACTHSGLVQEGYKYFNSMACVHDIAPRIEHYGCMVDLLGKAGLLEEASKFIDDMPIEPNLVIWGSLLAACRVHQKVELGEKIARKILETAPMEEGAHVLIFNIYAEAGRWNDARRVRAQMGKQGIDKFPGYSAIEVNGILHEFIVQDTLHQDNDQIYHLLSCLTLQLKELSLGLN